MNFYIDADNANPDSFIDNVEMILQGVKQGWISEFDHRAIHELHFLVWDEQSNLYRSELGHEHLKTLIREVRLLAHRYQNDMRYYVRNMDVDNMTSIIVMIASGVKQGRIDIHDPDYQLVMNALRHSSKDGKIEFYPPGSERYEHCKVLLRTLRLLAHRYHNDMRYYIRNMDGMDNVCSFVYIIDMIANLVKQGVINTADPVYQMAFNDLRYWSGNGQIHPFPSSPASSPSSSASSPSSSASSPSSSASSPASFERFKRLYDNIKLLADHYHNDMRYYVRNMRIDNVKFNTASLIVMIANAVKQNRLDRSNPVYQSVFDELRYLSKDGRFELFPPRDSDQNKHLMILLDNVRWLSDRYHDDMRYSFRNQPSTTAP